MVERRKHTRYPMPQGTFAILRQKLASLSDHAAMSIGEIAMVLYRSKTEALGQVSDLSFGGLAFSGTYCHLGNTEPVELDLLMAEQGIYLHNVPFSVVPMQSFSDKSKDNENHRNNVILRFEKLDAKQKRQLQELLYHHIG